MMARGNLWTDDENSLLLGMVAQGLSPQAIFDSGKFSDRTVDAIRAQVQRLGSYVQPRKSNVQTIQPSADSLRMEEAVKFFSTAFKQICELQEVDKLKLERFRIIFQAARDYGPLLASYEKWDKIEKKIEELSAAVVELQAAKGAKKTS
jgi:hypothetical protein